MERIGKGRREWTEDLNQRQRNTVFPDTTENERRFWLHIVSGKQRLSVLHVVGLLLIAATLLITLGFAMRTEWWAEARTSQSAIANVVRVYGGQLLALFVVAAFVALVTSVRRTRRRKQRPK